jgi:hypothetical protein
VTLTAEERQEWPALLAKGKANAHTLAPARVLLPGDESEAAPGRSAKETASALNLSGRPVERVRARFVEQGFAATLRPAPSQRVSARTFAGASQARLIAWAGGAPPEGQSRGTRRLLAEQRIERPALDRVSHQGVRPALKTTNSHRSGERKEVGPSAEAVGGVGLSPGRGLGGVSSGP